MLLTSCGGGKKQPQQAVVEGQTGVEKKSARAVPEWTGMPGKATYDAVCLACHQEDGSGVPGMHPPLVNSDRVKGNPDSLIHIVLHGMKGEIEIAGEVYNNIMPPQSQLTNQQVAEVLTYVRKRFGEGAGSLTPEEVQKQR